jgi:hypothetical protein
MCGVTGHTVEQEFDLKLPLPRVVVVERNLESHQRDGLLSLFQIPTQLRAESFPEIGLRLNRLTEPNDDLRKDEGRSADRVYMKICCFFLIGLRHFGH